MFTGDNTDYNYIYVVFLVTNTFIGKMIRLVTRNQYNHVTLAFDHELRQMYSFARYHINSPISGGFVVEQPERYLCNNKDVTVKICRMPVNEEEYHRIRQEVSYFHANREEMLYNTLNAVLSLLKKRVDVRNTFTCVEFVAHLLRFPNIWEISELERRLEKQVIYSGSFRRIAREVHSYQDEDDYFEKRHAVSVVIETVFHFKKIVVRMIGI